jgi:hypothetical protein
MTFQVFISTLRDYITTLRNEQIRNFMADPLMRLTGIAFGPTFEQVKLRISQLQSELNKKYERYPYKALMGVSSKYFEDRRSSLYYFEADGRFTTPFGPKAIGSGSSHASYFLKRYWNQDITTMNEFAQLGDFLIRYISHPQITLDNAVGLNPERPYPQILFIPDDPNFCCQYNNGEQKHDCTPTQNEFEQYRDHSEQWLDALHERPFYPTTVPS